MNDSESSSLKGKHVQTSSLFIEMLATCESYYSYRLIRKLYARISSNIVPLLIHQVIAFLNNVIILNECEIMDILENYNGCYK